MRFLTEKILWSQIREGDMSAFEELFNLYADSLLAYGMKFTHDRERVKDIIQDLFVRIIKRHDSLPEVENLKAYLLQAFRNNLINNLSTDRLCSFDENDLLRQQAEDNIMETVDDYSPDDDMLRRHLRVRQALSTLTPHQKEVIHLRYVQELPAADIARMLGINVQSVRNDIHRVILGLRKQIIS